MKATARRSRPVMRATVVALLALVLAAAPARAGSPDAPELSDAAGDCASPPGALGNEYLDIVSAWISDESDTAFNVNLAIAKWNDAAGEASGFTVQFSHQGVEWGVIVAYSQQFFAGWSYQTGQADADSASGFNDTTGSFTPGSPAIITASFPKSLFPHNDPTDSSLVSFNAFSADLKSYLPFAIAQGSGAPVDANGHWIVCDEAVGDGEYEFGSGGHSAHAPADDESAMTNATAQPSAPTGDGAPGASDKAEEPAKTLPVAPLLAAAALAGAAAIARRPR